MGKASSSGDVCSHAAKCLKYRNSIRLREIRMPNKPKPRDDDWFEALEAELDKKTATIRNDVAELTKAKAEINRRTMEDFWKIWLRFNKMNVHFTLQPEYSEFLRFSEFPDEWSIRDDFRFGSVNSIELTDRTSDGGRMGDRLKLFYHSHEGRFYVRMTLEYFEGEHYYKYSGWKRIFGQYVLYDAAVGAFSSSKFHEVLGDVVKYWFESHLRRSREALLDHLKAHYPAGNSFSE